MHYKFVKGDVIEFSDVFFRGKGYDYRSFRSIGLVFTKLFKIVLEKILFEQTNQRHYPHMKHVVHDKIKFNVVKETFRRRNSS